MNNKIKMQLTQMRFEIPRNVLNGINELGTGAEKIAALNARLAEMGITEDLITAQTQTVAVAFDKLRGAGLDALTAVGAQIATSLLPLVTDLTTRLTYVAENFQFAFQQQDKVAAASGAILLTTSSVDQFNQKVREANAQIPFYIAKLQEMSPAQYAVAQALLQSGLSVDEVTAKFRDFGAAATEIEQTIQSYRGSVAESDAATQTFVEALTRLTLLGPEGAAAAQLLAENTIVEGNSFEYGAYQAGLLAEQLLRKQQAEMEAKAATEAQTAATTNATSALQVFNAELISNATEAATAQVQTDALKFAQEQIYGVALQAANGLISSADAAAILASQFGVAEAAAYGLINALAQLQKAKALEAAGLKAEPIHGGHAFNQKSYDSIIKDRKAIQENTKALRDHNYQKADYAGKLKILQNELNKTEKYSAAYYNKLDEIARLEEQQAKKGAGKKGGVGAAKLSDADKVNNQLLAQQDKFHDKFEDAEQKHVEKLSEIYDDYYKKLKEQQEKNEMSKRRSKYDFYTGNEDLPEGLDPAKYAAQYEDAFSRAQEIAKNGQAALAQEYLDLRQKHIEEMRSLDEEAAKIQADEDLSSTEKEAALSYLEGRRKLLQDAQDEELKQLQEHGDAINNELKGRLDEETKAYEEQTGKIATAADRKAEAIINAAERSRKKISEENLVLAEQLGLVEDITRAADGVGAKPGSTGTSPGTINPAQQKAISEGILVRQADVWRVIDQDVVNSISDLGARLEGKLDAVIGAVNSANSSISGAIGRIRTSSSGIVQ